MDTTHLHPDAPPDLALHCMTFEAWVDACWSANRYRDAYIEDFGLDDARYASVSGGGDVEAARSLYYKALFQLPRNTELALATYDDLPSELQTLALEHFDALRGTLQWRENAERTLADGVRLWVSRESLRSIGRLPALTLYRSVSPVDVPHGSSATLPLRRAGEHTNARATGRVIERDGQVWLNARYPGSACTNEQRFLVAAPFATLTVDGRPEKPASSTTVALVPHDYFEVDQRPNSAYFVTARQPLGSSALLLGPFATHLEALSQTAVASAYVHTKARTAPNIDVSIGTGRIDAEAGPVPAGKLNSALLEPEQLARVSMLLAKPPAEAAAASA